jgi:hypothetical protein
MGFRCQHSCVQLTDHLIDRMRPCRGGKTHVRGERTAASPDVVEYEDRIRRPASTGS